MKLQERLTLFTVSLTVILSTLLGGLLVQENYRSSLALIDADIMRVALAVNSSDSDKVTTALSLTQEVSTPIAIFLATNDEDPILLQGAPEIEDLQAARLPSDPTGEIFSSSSTRLAYVALEGESSLLLAASSSRIAEELRDNILIFVFTLIFITLVSVYLLRRVISRDVERERILIENQEKLRIESAHQASLVEFAGDASHELRTPLTVIMGYVELARQSGVNLNDPKILDSLLKACRRIDNTVTQLLDLYSIDAHSALEVSEISLSSMLREQAEMLAHLDPDREIKLDLIPDFVIKTDEELVRRILSNIFINVHRHTKRTDAVEVVLSSGIGNARIEVHDSGPGIMGLEEDFKTRVFKRFDRSRSQSTGGSGLGLSIIKASVSKLGGELEISRSHLGGTLVAVVIPLMNEISQG